MAMAVVETVPLESGAFVSGTRFIRNEHESGRRHVGSRDPAQLDYRIVLLAGERAEMGRES
jgi:hypothetical protein